MIRVVMSLRVRGEEADALEARHVVDAPRIRSPRSARCVGPPPGRGRSLDGLAEQRDLAHAPRGVVCATSSADLGDRAAASRGRGGRGRCSRCRTCRSPGRRARRPSDALGLAERRRPELAAAVVRPRRPSMIGEKLLRPGEDVDVGEAACAGRRRAGRPCSPSRRCWKSLPRDAQSSSGGRAGRSRGPPRARGRRRC